MTRIVYKIHDAAVRAVDVPPGSMQGVAAELRPNSRLSCQLVVTAALDGLTVEIPDLQF